MKTASWNVPLNAKYTLRTMMKPCTAMQPLLSRVLFLQVLPMPEETMLFFCYTHVLSLSTLLLQAHSPDCLVDLVVVAASPGQSAMPYPVVPAELDCLLLQRLQFAYLFICPALV